MSGQIPIYDEELLTPITSEIVGLLGVESYINVLHTSNLYIPLVDKDIVNQVLIFT